MLDPNSASDTAALTGRAVLLKESGIFSAPRPRPQPGLPSPADVHREGRGGPPPGPGASRSLTFSTRTSSIFPASHRRPAGSPWDDRHRRGRAPCRSPVASHSEYTVGSKVESCSTHLHPPWGPRLLPTLPPRASRAQLRPPRSPARNAPLATRSVLQPGRRRRRAWGSGTAHLPPDSRRLKPRAFQKLAARQRRAQRSAPGARRPQRRGGARRGAGGGAATQPRPQGSGVTRFKDPRGSGCPNLRGPGDSHVHRLTHPEGRSSWLSAFKPFPLTPP